MSSLPYQLGELLKRAESGRELTFHPCATNGLLDAFYTALFRQ